MEKTKKVYGIKKIYEWQITQEKSENIILEKVGEVWVYHASSTQNLTVEQLEEILSILKSLS